MTADTAAPAAPAAPAAARPPETGLPDTGVPDTVAVPRWALRLFLGLCPYFAALIAVHAFGLLSAGIGALGWLDTLFWVAVICFALSSLGAVLVYLAKEPALGRVGRRVLGGLAAAVAAVTAVLSIAVLSAG